MENIETENWWQLEDCVDDKCDTNVTRAIPKYKEKPI
jgi:hypothetical protein